MSSTNKTSNLGLNQWELKDVYQMADFNADNAKIDAAVGLLTESLAGNLKLELIKEASTEAGTTGFSADLSDVDLGEYFCVIVQVPGTETSSFFFGGSIGTVSGYFYCIGFPFKNGDTPVHMIMNGNSELKRVEAKTSSGHGVRYSDVKTVSLGCGVPRNMTTRILVWGIK